MQKRTKEKRTKAPTPPTLRMVILLQSTSIIINHYQSCQSIGVLFELVQSPLPRGAMLGPMVADGNRYTTSFTQELQD